MGFIDVWYEDYQISKFDGSLCPFKFYKWLQKIDKIYEKHNFSDYEFYKLVQSSFIKNALRWWEKVKEKRRRSGKEKIHTWSKLRRELKGEFLLSSSQKDCSCNSCQREKLLSIKHNMNKLQATLYHQSKELKGLKEAVLSTEANLEEREGEDESSYKKEEQEVMEATSTNQTLEATQPMVTDLDSIIALPTNSFDVCFEEEKEEQAPLCVTLEERELYKIDYQAYKLPFEFKDPNEIRGRISFEEREFDAGASRLNLAKPMLSLFNIWLWLILVFKPLFCMFDVVHDDLNL